EIDFEELNELFANFENDYSDSLSELSQTESTSNSLVPIKSTKSSSNSFDSNKGLEPWLENFIPTFNLLPDLGFPDHELLLQERNILLELTSACTLLKNPYKRMREHTFGNSGCRVHGYYFYRLIRSALRLTTFGSKSRSIQGRLLKDNLMRMMALRSVLLYNEYRDAWSVVDVSEGRS